MRVPSWISGTMAFVCLAYGQQAPPSAASAQTPTDGKATIATTAEEVVLDLIVRDKKGRPVRDLKADEIEISDGDHPVKIRSLRFKELEQATESVDSEAKKHFDPLQQVRLVTMLFDQLTVEPAIQAKMAAHELIKAGTAPNVYFSVLRMASKLVPLQEFTNDGPALHKAIDKFIGSKINMQTQAQQVESRLRNMAGGDFATQQAVVSGDTSALSATDAHGAPTNPTAAPMAALLLNIIQTATIDANEVQGRPILAALRAAADQQKNLPGRKTIVYFTEGWNLTYALKDQFQALISAANRANVSFYIVDAGGLVTGARNEAARKMLSQAAQTSSSQGGSGAVSFNQAQGVDATLESMNQNTQTALMDLAGSTGGTFIADSNDLRRPMQKLAEDVNAYYEVNYAPEGRRMDAHFRAIKVKVNRPGVKVQARSGYFDLPHGSTNLKGSWEMIALKALEENPAPAPTFGFLAKAFPLRRQHEQVTGELVYQIPIGALEPEQNPSTKVFKLRLGVVALFRNADGKIMQKLSRDVAHEGAQESWERAKTSNFTLTQTFQVPAGAYSVEMAVVDAVGVKASVMRIPVSFAAAPGDLDLGGPILVERLDPVNSLPEGDPLRYEKARVLPSLAGGIPIDPKKQDGVPLFFLVHPAATASSKPELALELRRNGEMFTTMNIPLPESKTPVEMPYVATLPTAALGGGKFELLAKLRQGDATVERKLEFEIKGEPRLLAKATVAGKTTSGSATPEPEEETLPVADLIAAPLHADLKPKPEDEARILNGARTRALEYASNLPNFVCMQVTRRFEQPVAKPPKEEWKELESLSEQLTYVDGHEKYQKINGVQRGEDMGRGVLSAGEFGTLLRMVFRAESKAEFKWHDLIIENGKKLHVFEYAIPRATSQYMIRPSHNSPAVPVAAKGTVTVDEDTYQIRKIHLAADGLPKKFPFQESVIEVEYDSFTIGDQFSLLPKSASVRVTAGKKVDRNAIEYLNYRKWGGTSELKFGDPVEAPASAPVKKQQ